jgi:peptidoglycan L-alanyl-D-glutamate endopeptidase CwlK
LGEIAEEALRTCPYDIAIIHGLRGKDLQDHLYRGGKSRLKFPESRHNATRDPDVKYPKCMSDALDFGPWIEGDIPWDDTHIFAVVAGCFMVAALKLGVTLRWGGDWDSDGRTNDQTLMDWGHVEINWSK